MPASVSSKKNAEKRLYNEIPTSSRDLRSYSLADVPKRREHGAHLSLPAPLSRRETRPVRLAVKRVMDVVGASVLFALCSPVFALIAVIVAADGGPVFHVSRRVGRGGRAFNCYKFRTMVADADVRLSELLQSDEAVRAEWERVRKLVRDPRVTSAGRLLRASSLDELPQLANVFMGSMSLVGPRPVPQLELDKYYGAYARDYLSIRPGLTGPWQVSGRSDSDYDRRVALDVEYACDISLRTDLRILCRTVTAVLFCKGAR